jgi:transcription initiation factor IIF auxiliary subunit
MNSYTADLKKSERAFKKRMKKEKIQSAKNRELDEKINASIILAEYIKGIKREEQIKTIRDKQYKLLPEFKENYNIFLIAWDILTDNIDQIESDLIRNKITIDNIKIVLNKLIENNAILEHQQIRINELIAA